MQSPMGYVGGDGLIDSAVIDRWIELVERDLELDLGALKLKEFVGPEVIASSAGTMCAFLETFVDEKDT